MMLAPIRKSNNNKMLLEAFIDFSYFICVAPFRITRVEAHPTSYKIAQYRPQRVIAALIALADLFGSITKIRQSTDTNLDNPVKYFIFMWSFAMTLLHAAFYKVLWTRQNDILRIIRISRESFGSSSHFTRLPLNAALFGWAFCSINLIQSFLPALKGTYLIPHPSANYSWSLPLVFKAHVTHSKFMFFQSNVSATGVNSSYIFTRGSSKLKEGLGDLSTIEIFGAIGHILFYTIRYIGAYYVDLFAFILAATLWLAVNQFVQEAKILMDKQKVAEASSELFASALLQLGNVVTNPVEFKKSNAADYILDSYEQLKRLCVSVNRVVGPIVFCSLFEVIFSYAKDLNSIFKPDGWHDTILQANFLLVVAMMLGLSADICKKMAGFSLWFISGNVRKHVEPEMRMAVIEEIKSKVVGISAYGVFTIDYPLIYNVVITTVTFYLIVVQFKPSC